MRQDVGIRIGNVWTGFYKSHKIWKSSLPDEIKRNFFRGAVEYVLQYKATTLMLTINLEKAFDTAHIRMFQAAPNISWRQYSTKK